MIKDVMIYKTEDGKMSFEVNLKEETVWLTQKQMAELFEKERSVITKHINNIFKEEELKKESNVQKMHFAHSDKPINFFNLDVIISVGYRVKSKRGTQFRIWATKILKDYLIKGYTINEKKLIEYKEKFDDLKKVTNLLENTVNNQNYQLEEAKGLLKVITDYSYALTILDEYDHQNVKLRDTTKKEAYILEYSEAMKVIDGMKDEFSTSLFGNEKDDGFKSALGAIYQTAFGQEVYPSLEEKGANLLYFTTKNHAFSDGNKRIASAVFIYFLYKNGILYKADGSKRIADNALVALTLMIAESKPKEKDTIVKVIVNLINKNN